MLVQLCYATTMVTGVPVLSNFNAMLHGNEGDESLHIKIFSVQLKTRTFVDLRVED